MSSEVTSVGLKREDEDLTTMAVIKKADMKHIKRTGNMDEGPDLFALII